MEPGLTSQHGSECELTVVGSHPVQVKVASSKEWSLGEGGLLQGMEPGHTSQRGGARPWRVHQCQPPTGSIHLHPPHCGAHKLSALQHGGGYLLTVREGNNPASSNNADDEIEADTDFMAPFDRLARTAMQPVSASAACALACPHSHATGAFLCCLCTLSFTCSCNVSLLPVHSFFDVLVKRVSAACALIP
eukprot:1157997-Pelagomonas_calceolata.AAC.6